MEEPGLPMSELFTKMQQLFPEIPLPVIQLDVLYYGRDPAMCQHMLELRRQYLASSPPSVAPIVNQLGSLNINSNFPESAIRETTDQRQKPASEQPLNHNQEFRSHSPRSQQVTNVPVSPHAEQIRGNRNFSYAGMSTSPPQILIPNPVLSAPITSVDYQYFNNAFHVAANQMPTLNQTASAGQSVSPNVAFVPSSDISVRVSSPPGVQTFSPSDVPSHSVDRNNFVWGTHPVTSGPLKAPYDSQLYVNVDPFYNYPHYPSSDKHPHSPYANFQFQNQPALQPSSSYVRGAGDHTNSLYIRNDLFNAAEDQRPQLIISSQYWNKNYSSNIPNAFPNGQQLTVGQISVPAASNAIFISRYVQDNLQHQTSKLNALKYEILQNKCRVDVRKTEVLKLEQQLKYKTYLPDKKMVQDMKDEISKLRVECHYLCMEVDLQLKGKAPLGMVDEDFYQTIFTGQQGPLLPATTQASSPSSATDQRQTCIEEEEENKESNTWECSMCTFANHPAISVCEMCHIPRKPLPGLSDSENLLKHDLSDGAGL